MENDGCMLVIVVMAIAVVFGFVLVDLVTTSDVNEEDWRTVHVGVVSDYEAEGSNWRLTFEDGAVFILSGGLEASELNGAGDRCVRWGPGQVFALQVLEQKGSDRYRLVEKKAEKDPPVGAEEKETDAREAQ